MADDPDTGSSRLETDAGAGRGGDHRMAYAALKAIHRRFILSSFDSDHSGTKMVQ
jgi:hypothetical protein